MTTPQCGRRPSAEAPSTGIATDQGAKSTVDGTAHAVPVSEDAENYWQGRRDSVAAWLPHATREAVEAFAMRHFDRAESAAFLIAEQIERDQRIAERMSSIEVSQALDWTSQAAVPSFATLQRRRSVVA
jgi:hypothetical protein